MGFTNQLLSLSSRLAWSCELNRSLLSFVTLDMNLLLSDPGRLADPAWLVDTAALNAHLRADPACPHTQLVPPSCASVVLGREASMPVSSPRPRRAVDVTCNHFGLKSGRGDGMFRAVNEGTGFKHDCWGTGCRHSRSDELLSYIQPAQPRVGATSWWPAPPRPGATPRTRPRNESDAWGAYAAVHLDLDLDRLIFLLGSERLLCCNADYTRATGRLFRYEPDPALRAGETAQLSFRAFRGLSGTARDALGRHCCRKPRHRGAPQSHSSTQSHTANRLGSMLLRRLVRQYARATIALLQLPAARGIGALAVASSIGTPGHEALQWVLDAFISMLHEAMPALAVAVAADRAPDFPAARRETRRELRAAREMRVLQSAQLFVGNAESTFSRFASASLARRGRVAALLQLSGHPVLLNDGLPFGADTLGKRLPAALMYNVPPAELRSLNSSATFNRTLALEKLLQPHRG